MTTEFRGFQPARTKRTRTVMGLLVAGLLSATALTASSTFMPPPAPAIAQTLATPAPASGFADLVEKVMPAVVSVEVKYTQTASGDDEQAGEGGGMELPPGLDQLPEDSPFRKFFEQLPQFKKGMPGGEPQGQQGRSEGSGFLISADGYAVTNNHVVKDAETVTVKFDDGKEYSAEVVGTDPKTDLALIRIKDATKPFTFVKFAAAEPRVGDWVVAVGNPFGLGGSVTTGIISARGRDIGSGPYDDFLQIDAPINRGNSGGPAFNLDGEVVGINTAIYSPSGGSVGIGFAIPASAASQIIEDLKSSGKVTRGWLGVAIQPVTDEIAESLGLKAAKGAIVADVTEDSPALKAGIKAGDVITKVNGDDIAEPKDLSRRVAGLAPGKDALITIERDGKSLEIKVAIAVMPGDKQAAAPAPSTSGAERTSLAALGLSLRQADDGAGVEITEVKPGTPGADSGLSSGDIIVEVAGEAVSNPADVRAAVAKAADAGQKRVLMLVRSGERQRFIALPALKG